MICAWLSRKGQPYRSGLIFYAIMHMCLIWLSGLANWVCSDYFVSTTRPPRRTDVHEALTPNSLSHLLHRALPGRTLLLRRRQHAGVANDPVQARHQRPRAHAIRQGYCQAGWELHGRYGDPAQHAHQDLSPGRGQRVGQLCILSA